MQKILLNIKVNNIRQNSVKLTRTPHKLLSKFWPLIIITITIFFFFARLFIPEPSIIITPDYGRSDAWHLSIANKFYYAQELKKNRIPIWNPHIGMGFPTLAEGQTGIFFLPNLVLFRSLPFVYAYNLNIVLTFILAAFGTYLFCRSLNLNKLASIFGGLIFALGGFLVVHIQHLHLIQTAAILPWLFWATNEFLKDRRIFFLLALSFFIAQQIFAGFPQLTFYSLVALFVSLFFRTFKDKVKIKLWIAFSVFVLLGLTLAAIQILPTYELLKISIRNSNPQDILTQFPYKFKNLAQFLNPYILGNPKDGSYPAWTSGQWGIYWESIAYIGILPLALAAISVIFVFKKKIKYKAIILVFITLLILSILLALGKSSPLHPVFSIPPFSMFRVPSRFLMITQFSLVILTTIALQKLARKKILLILIFTVSLVNLFYVFFNYHALGLAQDWFANPAVAKSLKATDHQRNLSIGQFDQWNETFTTKGWQDTSYYYFARNSLDQNSNLIYGLTQLKAYESIPTRRSNLLNSLIERGITKENEEYKIASQSARILASVNVSHIISTLANNDQEFEKIFETEKYVNYSFKILKNKTPPMQIFMTSQYSTVQTIGELTAKFSSPDIEPTIEIVLEKEPNMQNLDLSSWDAKILSKTPTNIQIKTESKGNGLLVLADSYYPGWEAYIDGTTTEIFAANINSRAIIVPEGTHEIVFMYKPKSLLIGSIISLLSLVIALVIFARSKKAKVV